MYYKFILLDFNFTACGEKIYIKEVRKPRKINGFGDLTIT